MRAKPLSSAVEASTPGRLARLLGRNSLANFVYLVYACIILVIDFDLSPQAAAAFRTGAWTNVTGNWTGDGTDDYYYFQSSDAYTTLLSKTNQLFVIAASIHLFNAVQYFLVWPELINPATGTTFSFFSYVMLPEYLNILGASLYLYTAANYDSQLSTGPGRFLDAPTLAAHKIETAAAVIELLAAFAWCYVWWWTHERGPGRGLTLHDPELIALILLVCASFLYVAYNGMLMSTPSNYYASPLATALYNSGDCIYFVGACFYAIVSFRDAGFFNSLGVPGRGLGASGGAAAAAQQEQGKACEQTFSTDNALAQKGGAAAAQRSPWERFEDAGDVWYVNHSTGESTWDPPPGFAR